MPIDILNSLGKITGGLAGANSMFNKVFSSPIYSAVLLAAIIIVIIILFVPSKKKKTKNIIKVGLYILMCNVLVLFLHDSALKETTKEHIMGHKNDGILDQMTTTGRANDPLSQNRVAVVPFKKKSNEKKEPSAAEDVKLVSLEQIGGTSENNPESEEMLGGNPLLDDEITGGEEVLYAPKHGGSKSPKFGVF